MFSDTNIVLTLVLSLVSAVLCTAEYLIVKCRALFLVLSTLYMTAACFAIIYKGGALCDALLVVTVTLAVRLFFEIKLGRKDK